MEIELFQGGNSFAFETNTLEFKDKSVTRELQGRYIKTRFPRQADLDNFVEQYKDIITKQHTKTGTKYDHSVWNETKQEWEFIEGHPDAVSMFQNALEEYLQEYIIDVWSEVEPFTFAEAFRIENEELKRLVMQVMNVTEFVSNLPKDRIAVEGKLVKHKTWDSNGNFTGYQENNVIYETYKIDVTKLEGDKTSATAIKCWCTTTNEEHWLWVEDKYANSPLDGIASLCPIDEAYLPLLEKGDAELMRQGDVFIVQSDSKVSLSGNVVTLNAEKYFEYLVAQS